MRANGDPERLRDQLTSKRPGDDVVVTVDRDGTVIRKQATLQEIPDGLGGTRAGLGFTFDTVEGPTQRYGFIGGIDQGLDFTWFVIKANGQVFGDVFTSQEAREQVSSVVGVGAVFNEVADDGLITHPALRRRHQPGARPLQPAADPAARRRPHRVRPAREGEGLAGQPRDLRAGVVRRASPW